MKTDIKKNLSIKWILIFLLYFIIVIGSYISIANLNTNIIMIESNENYIYGITCCSILVINFIFILVIGFLISFKTINYSIKYRTKDTIKNWLFILMYFFSFAFICLGSIWSYFVINDALLRTASEGFARWCSSLYGSCKVYFSRDSFFLRGFEVLNISALPFYLYIFIFSSFIIWNTLTFFINKNYKRNDIKSF